MLFRSDIDNNYVIGGKPIIIPGDSFSSTVIKRDETEAGTYAVSAPTADELPLSSITLTLGGSGGYGGTTTSTGSSGANTSYTFNANGYTYETRATGGGGGTAGESGGGGGAGGDGFIYVKQGGTTVQTINLSSITPGTTNTITGGVEYELQSY